MTKYQYPECEKLAADRPKKIAIMEFLEWLEEQGLTICDLDGFRLRESNEQLVHRHLGLDDKKLEQERREMLRDQRIANEAKHARPQYRHDCKACRFLGRFAFSGPLSDGTTQHFDSDLYVCFSPRGSAETSVIARFSDTNSDYSSSLTELVERDYEQMKKTPSTKGPGILEAYDRWKAASNE